MRKDTRSNDEIYEEARKRARELKRRRNPQQPSEFDKKYRHFNPNHVTLEDMHPWHEPLGPRVGYYQHGVDPKCRICQEEIDD